MYVRFLQVKIMNEMSFLLTSSTTASGGRAATAAGDDAAASAAHGRVHHVRNVGFFRVCRSAGNLPRSS